MIRPAALAALSLALAGCTAAVHPDAPLPSADALLASRWSPQGRTALRQMAIVALGDRESAIEGALVLDPDAGTARLVALDPLGIKLFDVTVGHDGPPVIAGNPLPGTDRAIAMVSESLRRIYLSPPSGPATGVSDEGADRVVAIRSGASRETWVIEAATGRLSRRFMRGRGLDWEVSYGAPVRLGETEVPGKIVLWDRAAGFRLTVTTVEVLE